MHLSPPAFLASPSPLVASAIGAAEIAQLRVEFSGDIQPLVEIFKQESPAVLLQMEAAIDGGNADALRRAAHALKGCCANFGARPMEALCQKMETTAQAGDIERAALLLEPVRLELKRVTSALECAPLETANL